METEKYLDETLSAEERARDLVSRMTLHECAGQLLFNAAAIERLGVEEYNWWSEALHGVARAGVATVFPQAIGMAASFDAPLLEKAADVISTEARAKYNEFQKAGERGIYQGLTFWSPNVNLFRDPRWGRGQETYGEDPYLSGVLGTAFVRGLQGPDREHLKVAACAKHFAVHSGPEKLRHEFDAVATRQDMEETYLPQFKVLCDAGVEGFMGAYNRVNGEPACGSHTLLKETLREKWGFDGYITSDCWAVNDFHMNHKVTSSPVQSIKLALENGCDVNCGCTYEYVQLAVEQGVLDEKYVREACMHLMRTRIRLGMFDKERPFKGLTVLDVDTAYARSLNEKMTRESLVLLKNKGILPLDASKVKTLTVTGPNANSITALNGNYHGVANQYVTVLEGVRAAFPEARVLYSEGCNLWADADKATLKGEVQAQAKVSDIVVVVTGLDETIEGEEDMGGTRPVGDKTTLLLPENQRKLIRDIRETGTPYIIVNLTGSAMDFSEEGEGAAAIIQAWYPGALGGKAVGDLLSGAFSPSGKLPVTFYHETDDIPEFTDYSMKNRTYKYFEGTPLYPFGYGLGYTKFGYQGLSVPEKVERTALENGEETCAKVTVKNEGAVDSDAVIEFYLWKKDAHEDAPRRRLAGFTRVSLASGEEKEVSVAIPSEMFTYVNTDGERIYESGTYVLTAGGSQPDERSLALTGEEVARVEITVK